MANKLYLLKTIQIINLLLFIAVLGLIAEHATHKSINKNSEFESTSKTQKIKS